VKAPVQIQSSQCGYFGTKKSENIRKIGLDDPQEQDRFRRKISENLKIKKENYN
jgi:hypothetical protein